MPSIPIHELPGETVRKVVRATLRPWIWPVYGVQNGPKSTLSMTRKATLQARPRLFGQSRKRYSRKLSFRHWPFSETRRQDLKKYSRVYDTAWVNVTAK